MQLAVDLMPDEEQGGFTAAIPEIPVCGEGDTEADAVEDLKESLRLYIEVRGIDTLVALLRPKNRMRTLNLADIIGFDNR